MKKALIFGLIAALTVAGNTQGREYEAMEFKGKALPNVSLTTPDGKTLTNKDFKNKVVVLDFFATWCGPCKAAAPKLQALHTKHSKDGLMIVALNTWERGADRKTPDLESYKKITAGYQAEHGYTYTFTTANDKLAETMKVQGVPTFFIVDKKGVVREVMVGFNEGLLNSTIAKLMAE